MTVTDPSRTASEAQPLDARRDGAEQPPEPNRQTGPGVAQRIAPLVRRVLGPNLAGVRLRCWDGSMLGADDAAITIVVNSPIALRRIVWAPGELGLARAYVAGDLEVEGDIFAFLDLRDRLAQADHSPSDHVDVKLGWRGATDALRAAAQLGAIGRPPPPPPEEVRLRGRRHSKERDAAAIAHHYDVGNDFYRLFLGDTLTYSCGFWAADDFTLDDAQRAKYDLICRKLGLHTGMRLLDVGCGWGGMVLHAAQHYGVEAVGVTLSIEQARLARQRLADAGLADRVEIRVQDYRDVGDGPYDAISSIGMFEHVGLARMEEYLADLRDLLRPRGRLLNHAISRPSPVGKPAIAPRSFIGRYVFPDGELLEVGTVVSAMQKLGLEVRDVESLREHYDRTLRTWVANLEANWDEAVRLAGPARAKVWRLYMAGSALNFKTNRCAIHQVLAVRTDPSGRADIPSTRVWAAEPERSARA